MNNVMEKPNTVADESKIAKKKKRREQRRKVADFIQCESFLLWVLGAVIALAIPLFIAKGIISVHATNNPTTKDCTVVSATVAASSLNYAKIETVECGTLNLPHNKENPNAPIEVFEKVIPGEVHSFTFEQKLFNSVIKSID